jgi:hypothetical protein
MEQMMTFEPDDDCPGDPEETSQQEEALLSHESEFIFIF